MHRWWRSDRGRRRARLTARPITGADQDRAALTAALTRVAARDRAALRDVYDRMSAKLFGVCLRIFPQVADAEDALQDAFVTIWQRAESFDPARGSPVTWLVTVTRNRAIDRLRATAPAHAPLEFADAVAVGGDDAEAGVIAGDEHRRLLHCVDLLPAGDAAMIKTAFFGGATYSELAERSSSPLGTIKSRVRRALMKLRECLT